VFLNCNRTERVAIRSTCLSLFSQKFCNHSNRKVYVDFFFVSEHFSGFLEFSREFEDVQRFFQLLWLLNFEENRVLVNFFAPIARNFNSADHYFFSLREGDNNKFCLSTKWQSGACESFDEARVCLVFG
jgi:hypothetical protein